MKKLLNTLYITSPDVFVSLDGETIVIKKKKHVDTRIPLHNIEGIVCFGYRGVSPALMLACAERTISLCFLSPSGRFQARFVGPMHGNVLLRKQQYRASDSKDECFANGKAFLLGKIGNCRKVLERTIRDHELVINKDNLQRVSNFLKSTIKMLRNCSNCDELFAYEGNAARAYFSVFNELILQQKNDFYFTERSRRPPMDNMNALLSFLYTLLANEVTSALDAVGLDPYVGFMHRDRPGRPSLALDLMEELRPVLADRLALTLVNRKQIDASGFRRKESGAIVMDDETRKLVIKSWQEKKQEKLIHPYLKEPVQYGLIPHIQASLLAKSLRGDIDGYPPFFWT